MSTDVALAAGWARFYALVGATVGLAGSVDKSACAYVVPHWHTHCFWAPGCPDTECFQLTMEVP